MSFARLDRCVGPACRRCGCQQATILREPVAGDHSWWGTGTAKCSHCGLVFGIKAADLEVEQIAEAEPDPKPEPTPKIEQRTIAVVTCEWCNVAMKISSTRKTIRWHKCPQCGRTKKTPR